jgi:hypothetical protein
MLLPAILELKKPRDAGPRLIMEDAIIAQRPQSIPLASIEEEKLKMDMALAKKISEIIGFLPNLEV